MTMNEQQSLRLKRARAAGASGRFLALRRSAAGAAFALAPGAALAQVDEIIVEAQKRAESVQDVGISISAYDEEQVKDLGLDDIDRLAAVTPNVQALDEAAGLPSFRVRGVGLNEFQAGFDSPVGIHLDEVFYSKPFLASLGFFDVQRIEVLKGPQGTVFGRNTTGGAVNFYSNHPTDEFSAGIRASYQRFQRAEIEGHVSGPLSESLRGRIAYKIVDQSSGPYFNLFDNRTIGEDKLYRVRGQIEWSDDRTNARLTAHYGSREAALTPYDNLFQSTPGGVPDVARIIVDPVGRFVVNQDYNPTTDSEAFGANLRIERDLGVGVVTSITSYEDFDRNNREDSDNTPIASTNIDWYSDIRQFTQELRFGGESGAWNYLVGIYYENDTLTQVDTLDASAVLGVFLGSDFEQKTNSFAAFTSHELALTDQLSLVLGARYTREKNDISGVGFVSLPTLTAEPKNRVDPSLFLVTNIGNSDRTDDDFNFKAGLNFAPVDDLLLYAFVTTGFRSGGYDFGLGQPLETFIPEDVLAIEAGLKSAFVDKTIQLNLSGFYSKTKDYQENVNLAGELIPRRRNIGELEIFGFEGEAVWQPNNRVGLQLSAGYTNAEIVSVNNDPNGVPFAVDGTPLLGNRPVNTPKFSAGAIAWWTQPIGGDLAIEPMASWTYVGERFLEIQNAADHLVSSYNTLDARVSIGPEDRRWRVSAFGRNITNTTYLRYINDVPAFGLFLTINNDPATWGVEFEMNI